MPKSKADSKLTSSEHDSVKITEADDSVSPARPVRATAERAQQQVHKWMTELIDNDDM